MTDLHKTLKPLVDKIKAGNKVTFFNGAGVSTGAGIPDFRSPKTGLYANLAKLNLPYAEAVFDIDYFRENPKAFYTLADELYPGKFQPTEFHYFIKLLHDKKLLKRVYTQNIDTLERIAGVDNEYMIEAHGSFANNHCIDCGNEMSVKEVKSFIAAKDIPKCHKCKGYVKPDIVFFGESLPLQLFEQWEDDCDDIDVAIVAGTSLTVYPFASLPSELGKDTLRVLINKEVVGDFKRGRKSDVVVKGECDEVAKVISEMMGWKEEMEEMKRGWHKEEEEEEEKTKGEEEEEEDKAHKDEVHKDNEDHKDEEVHKDHKDHKDNDKDHKDNDKDHKDNDKDHKDNDKDHKDNDKDNKDNDKDNNSSSFIQKALSNLKI